jgi:prepilin-type N-terminal cleavage/methylation domain-containing protein
MNHQTQKNGFTLIELLVVIAIIALLSTTVMTSISKARMKSRDTQRVENLRQIRVALELYFDDHGYYPRSDCGWDCNGYRYSYTAASWNALATDLAPYITVLPKDPLNSTCAPWNANCYSYAYGNVGRTTYKPQYDLTTQLEDTGHQARCAVKSWRFYFDNRLWCPPYSNQIYEASTY